MDGVKVIVIEDPDDARYRQFRLGERGLASRAAKRDDAGAGRFLAEGDLVVERALDAGCRPIAALVDIDRMPVVAKRLDCPVYGGGVAVRRAVTKLGVPSPIITLFERPARSTVADLARSCERVVVVEGVDNPSNVGAIVRNAAGLGWDGLLLDHTSADPFARRALRVAMGTTFALPHARSTSLVEHVGGLDGFQRYALTPDPDAIPIDEVTAGERTVLIAGSERSGLSDALLGLATPVRIPMAAGVDSLNVAAAVAVACWALRHA